MNEYWEITHERSVATQAVWAMKPAFELNKLNKTQHSALSDSLPTLAQARDDAEDNLGNTIAAKNDIFAKLQNIAVRMPGLADGLLDDGDPLKDQLDDIFAIDSDLSENHVLRRCRLIMPFWTDVNAALAAATPPKPPITLDYGDPVETIGVGEFSSAVAASLAAQKNEAEKQRLVTNAKSALRAADRKTDRGNKRWYKAWLKAYPEGTAEGDAALSQIPTEQGVAQAEALEILMLVAQANHTVHIDLDPAGGAHATTKELQYQLPGEPEFGHSAPITGNQMEAGPFTAGITVNFRTRVSNSNPGTVNSTVKSVVVI